MIEIPSPECRDNIKVAVLRLHIFHHLDQLRQVHAKILQVFDLGNTILRPTPSEINRIEKFFVLFLPVFACYFHFFFS